MSTFGRSAPTTRLQVRRANPETFDEGDAEEVTGQLAEAIVSLDELLEQTHDFTIGDAQWHALRLVLDWFVEWDAAYLERPDRIEDPAPHITLFPVAFQYMTLSDPTSMHQAAPYIEWSLQLLQRVVSQSSCRAQLTEGARNSDEIIYWRILSRPCALLLWSGMRQLQLLKLNNNVELLVDRFEVLRKMPLFEALQWKDHTRLHLQLPRYQHITRGWWDTSQFQFARTIEGSYREIRKELTAALASKSSEQLWQRPDAWTLARPEAGWRILYVGDKCDLFPRTCAIWRRAIGAEAKLREVHEEHYENSLIFYFVEPGTRLIPHEGRPNQMVFQLGIHCPGSATLRVGNVTKVYSDGQTVLFEDAWEHELRFPHHNAQSRLQETGFSSQNAARRIVMAAVLKMGDYFNTPRSAMGTSRTDL